MVDVKYAAGIIPRSNAFGSTRGGSASGKASSVQFSGAITPVSTPPANPRKLAVELMGLCTPGRVIGDDDAAHWGKEASESPSFHTEDGARSKFHYTGNSRTIPGMYTPISSDKPISELMNKLGCDAEMKWKLFSFGLISTDKPTNMTGHSSYQVHPLVAIAAMKAHGDLGRVEEKCVDLPEAFKREYPEFTKLAGASPEFAQKKLGEAMSLIESREPDYWGLASLYKPLLDFLVDRK